MFVQAAIYWNNMEMRLESSLIFIVFIIIVLWAFLSRRQRVQKLSKVFTAKHGTLNLLHSRTKSNKSLYHFPFFTLPILPSRIKFYDVKLLSTIDESSWTGKSRHGSIWQRKVLTTNKLNHSKKLSESSSNCWGSLEFFLVKTIGQIKDKFYSMCWERQT